MGPDERRAPTWSLSEHLSLRTSHKPVHYILLSHLRFGLGTSKFSSTIARFILGCLFFLDTVHSVVVTNYGNPSFFLTVSWTLLFTGCATAIAALLSHICLCYRVYILTKNKTVTAVIAVLTILGSVFGMWSGVCSALLHEVAKLGVIIPFVTVWFGFQTAADVMITIVLIIVLQKARTGFHETDFIINRLIRGAIQSGLFASMFVIGGLFGFLLSPHTFLYTVFAYPLGRVYTNTLLYILNARRELRTCHNAIVEVDS